MSKSIFVCMVLSALAFFGSFTYAAKPSDVVVVNKILFDDADVRQNQRSMRRLRSMIRADGAVFVWVALKPQIIGFNVLEETLSIEQREHQQAVLRQALDTVLSALHSQGQIQRAPTYVQRGVSELVKVTDHKALRELIEHRYVQLLTLDPGFSNKLKAGRKGQ